MSAQQSIRPENTIDKVLMTGDGVENGTDEEDADDDVFAKENHGYHVELDPANDAEGLKDEDDHGEDDGEHEAEAMRILPDPGDPTPQPN